MHHLQYAALGYMGYRMYSLSRLPNDSESSIDDNVRPAEDDSDSDRNCSATVTTLMSTSVQTNRMENVASKTVTEADPNGKMVSESAVETDPGCVVETIPTVRADTIRSVEKTEGEKGALMMEMLYSPYVIPTNCELGEHSESRGSCWVRHTNRLLSLVNWKGIQPDAARLDNLDTSSTAVIEFERKMIEDESNGANDAGELVEQVTVDNNEPESMYADQFPRPPSPVSLLVGGDDPDTEWSMMVDAGEHVESECTLLEEEYQEGPCGKVYLEPTIETPTSPSANSDDRREERPERATSSRALPTALLVGECSCQIRQAAQTERTHREQLSATDEMMTPIRKKTLRRPKRTKNPFFAFKNANWWLIRAEMPEMSGKYQVVRELARRWREMSEEEKHVYKNAACVKRRRGRQ